MNVTITIDEFDAICFAVNQIETEIESADDDFAHDASVHLDNLYNVCAKYKAARSKNEELNMARRYVRTQKPNAPKSEVEKLARMTIKAAHKK